MNAPMDTPIHIPIGATGAAEMIVTSSDTAIAMRSGDVPVLSTPRVLALMEEATCEALRGYLPDSHTSVGASVSISHRKPTPVDARAMARAEVMDVDGATVVFAVSLDHRDASGESSTEVAGGTITRVVVTRDRF